MALRSNSKKVKERIKNYIIEGFHDSDFERWYEVEVNDYSVICRLIFDSFVGEYLHGRNKYMNKQFAFVEWLSGLPSIVNSMYYYNVSAIDLLGEWLEESEKEKERFSESEAELTISRLIYREITANMVGKYSEKVEAGDIEKMFEGIVETASHDSDLYVVKNSYSDFVVEHSMCYNNPLLSTFKDAISGNISYDLPLCHHK